MALDIDYAAARRDGYSDLDILQGLQASGKLDFDAERALKDGHSATEIMQSILPPSPAPAKPDQGNFVRGAKETFQQIPQLGYGLLAGAGAAMESAVGEGGIATGFKKAGVKGYQDWGNKIASDSKPSDSFSVAYDEAKQGNFGAMVDWLQHGLGYAAGQGVQMLATAGVGSLVGKAALKGAAEKIASGLVSKEAARIAATEEGARLGADALTKIATSNVASKIGQTVAIGANAFGQEGGEIFGDLSEKSVNENRALSGAELAKAFGATLAAGGLEFVGDKIGLDVMLGKSALVKPAAGMAGMRGRLARGALAGAAEAPIEGATEYGQTLLEEYGKGNDPFSADSLKQAKDAAALGALAGGGMGGVGGMVHGAQHTQVAPLQLTNKPDPLLSFPDGSVGRQSDADAFIASLPEPDRNAARARLFGYESQPVTPEDVMRSQSLGEAIAVANRAIEEGTPEFKAQKEADIDAAWGQYLGDRTNERQQGYDAAEQARRDADMPAMAAQAQDQAVAQANALTSAQGFDEQQPTALQLAFQKAQASRQDRLAEARQRATVQDQQQNIGEQNGRQADAGSESEVAVTAVDGGGGASGRRNETAGAGLQPDAGIPAARASTADTGGSGPVRNDGLRGIDSVHPGTAEAERALDGSSGEKREVSAGLPSTQANGPQPAVINKAKSILTAAGVTGNERMAALRAIRSGENTLDDLIDAHPPKEKANDTAPVANSVQVPDERTAGAATYSQKQPSSTPALQATSQPAAQQSADTAATGVAGRTGVSGADSTGGRSATLSKVSGERIDRDWTRFARESGTLDIERSQMPQVRAEHRGAMVNYLNARGITHETTEVPAGDLKPTQREYSPEKVQKARDYQGGDRSILVSSDNHVLDGHHQWLAKLDAGDPVKVIRLNAPIRELLEQVKEFPSSEVDQGAAPAKPRAAQFEKVEQQQSRLEAEIEKAKANATQRVKLKQIAERLGVRVTEVNGGYRSVSGSVEIPAEDAEVKGAQTPEHVFAHELGHAVMAKRGISFQGFPKNEMVRYASNYDELVAAAKDFRPTVHNHADERIRRYARKPNEILADAIGAVLLGDQPLSLLEPLMEKMGITERDLGMQSTDAKPRKSESPAKGGMRAEDVNRSLTMLRAKWLGFTRINVVQSVSDIPQEIASRAFGDGFSSPNPTFDSMEGGSKLLSDLGITESIGPKGERRIDIPRSFYDNRDKSTESKSPFQVMSVGTNSNGDISDSHTGVVQRNGQGEIVLSHRLGDFGPAKGKSPGLESMPNGGPMQSTKMISDLLVRSPGAAHLYSLFNTPGRAIFTVDPSVLTRGDNLKIVDGVIQSIPINMMDYLFSGKTSSNVSFHNKSMLELPRNSFIESVSLPLDVSGPFGTDHISGFGHDLASRKNTNYTREQSSSVEGFYDPKTHSVYLIADNISSKERAVWASIHEVQGHGGLRALKDKSVNEALNLAGANKFIKDLATAIQQDRNTTSPETEEAIAELAAAIETDGFQSLKNRYGVEVPASARNGLRGTIARVLDAVKRFLAAAIGKPVSSVSDADVRALIGAQREAVSEDDAQRSFDNGSVMASTNIDQTETAAFKRWFGDSKVVDEQGDPLVVYHGTNKDISKFKGSHIWVTADPGLANQFVAGGRRKMGDKAGRGSALYPVYASIKRPVDLRGLNLAANVTVSEILTRANIDPTDGILEKMARDNLASGYIGVAASVGDPVAYVVNNYRNGSRLSNLLDDPALKAALQDGGIDGIHLNESYTEGARKAQVSVVADTYAAFNPSQIKSAVGNNGNFDPNNANILQSRAPDSGAWDIPGLTKFDDLIHAMQDKQIDMKRIVSSIRASGKAIVDEFNPYLQEELFYGRSAKGVKDFLDAELRPLVQDMQMRGVDMSDFEEFLWNRHAEERNDQIAKINDQMPDGGSGIKTADARKYLAELTPQKRSAYDALAKRIDAINTKTRSILVSSGLEKQETINAWGSAYEHYVPLQREDVETGGNGTGQGFSIRGSSSKRAVGSNKPVANIIANIAMQRERTIVRAEKNRVSTALLGLAKENPNADFWDVDNAPTERVVQEIGGQDKVVERIVPGFRSKDNVVLARVNGEDHFVTFNEKEPRAVRMARSIKNLDADQLGRVLSATAKATRYLAAINTQYNPIFGIINLMRDTQDSMLNLSSTPIAGEQKKVLGYTASALAGIYSDLRAHRAGKQATSAWANLFEEFQNEGGQTGYRDQYANADQRAEAIAKEIKSLDRHSALKAGGAIFDWLSDYNESMENAVRLAAYRTAKESGMSNQQAASLAKNLTVNFNRKGQVATQVGSLYAFFNASVQGTARLTETLRGPMGKKIITGGIMLGAMQALLLAGSDMGDDEPPEFVRSRSLILPIGDKKYLTLPMPLGFAILPNLGRIPMEFMLGGFRNPTKRVADLVGLFADTFNPIGNAGISLQTIAPSLIDPLAALAENRDWTGKQIARGDMNSLAPTPGYTRANDTATSWSKAIAYGLNILSGGTDYKQGLVSPTPDQLDYLIGQVTGGVGRELSKAEQVVSSTATGEDLPIYKIPLVGRFVGNASGQAAESSKFYSAIKRINEHDAEITGLRKDRKAAEARQYISENREALLVPLAKKTEYDLRKLKHEKREALDAGRSEQVKMIEARIAATMAQFNKRVEAARKSDG